MYAILIVPSNFPNGDAGAVRDMAFAKIYQELGYEVILIGMGKNSHKGIYKDVQYYSLYKERKNKFQHLIAFLSYKYRCIKCLKQIINRKKCMPSLIHINDIPESMVNYLIKLSEKEHIPIIHDSTEWYSPCEFKRGVLDKAYILKDRTNKYVIKTPIKVIAISKYLDEHFRSKNLKTVRIPVIMDIKNTNLVDKYEDNIINLVYAGSPASKDYLVEIIEAIMIFKKADKIKVHIFGIDEYQLMNMCNTSELPENIKVYGRVPREQVLEAMVKMDFSLLLRPTEERYTKAGFPTKSVEAMSHGVAMMCNLTSDLDMYLIDGKNAIVIS
ncbi:glycosyltransferase [Clostridium perfringens]|nr:glycosyltransferase [Clostridium perfringens]ELU5588903.1 glycosyltransferase [Clostridium perfringens]